jgi:hypothetical protein
MCGAGKAERAERSGLPRFFFGYFYVIFVIVFLPHRMYFFVATTKKVIKKITGKILFQSFPKWLIKILILFSNA